MSWRTSMCRSDEEELTLGRARGHGRARAKRPYETRWYMKQGRVSTVKKEHEGEPLSK